MIKGKSNFSLYCISYSVIVESDAYELLYKVFFNFFRFLYQNYLLISFPLVFSRDQDMSWVAHYSMFYSWNDIIQC